MPLSELKYRVVNNMASAGGHTVHAKTRLQYWGRDDYLYANNGFASTKVDMPRISPFLAAFLTLARRNDSGIEYLQVTPNSMLVKTGVLSVADVSELVKQAARVAGLTPKEVVTL
ncbi:hypothetical protein KDA23_02030 [Candidatus Saccharibacteria bacterium]|nr:hypothetical protein [Candidatus Saccharibacteria bacterium]